MHSHMGTRLPCPLPRAADSKNRLLSSSSAFAAALPLINGLTLALAAQHLTPLLPLLLLLLPPALALNGTGAGAAAGAGWAARREGENAVAARDSIAVATAGSLPIPCR